MSASDRLLRSRDPLRALVTTAVIAADHALLFLAVMTGAALRQGELISGNTPQLFMAIAPAYALACSAFHSYDIDVLRRRSSSLARALMSLFMAAGISLAAAYAFRVSEEMSRLEAGFTLLAALLYLALGRFAAATYLARLGSALDPSVIVIGDERAPPGVPAVNLDVTRLNWKPVSNDPEFLGELFRAIRHADRVIMMFKNPDERRDWGVLMRQMGVNAEVAVPDLTSTIPLGLGRWSGMPTLMIARGPLTLRERVVKRVFDVGVTLALLPVLLPVALVLMVLVRAEDGGPALFKQRRVGRNNRRYRCYKLRTMRVETHDLAGARSASRDDDRLTRIGRFLRKTSLDELPQLWNVLRGDMSLVGPRPHALGSTAEGALFWDIVPDYWTRHAMKPGVTGLAQVRGFRGPTLSRSDIEGRVAADFEYINGWSLWRDIVILFRTVGVIMHRNAY
jgi:exopolysaccharide biosynthesis polyprenyl glycosylphosphotransferase